MLKKKNRKKPVSAVNTIIGREVTIEAAKIIGSGAIRIDGKFHGDIELDGGLTIGETGYVCGNIWVKEIFIGGRVRGDLHCEGKAHLYSTARFYGGMETGYLVMDEGVIFDGGCRTLRTEAIREEAEEDEVDEESEAIDFYAKTGSDK